MKILGEPDIIAAITLIMIHSTAPGHCLIRFGIAWKKSPVRP